MWLLVGVQGSREQDQAGWDGVWGAVGPCFLEILIILGEDVGRRCLFPKPC